jgi:hypothetical protein
MKITKKLAQSYKKRKHILDLEILQRYNINRNYLIFAILGLLFFMYNKKYFMFIAVTLFSAVFSFYHSKVNRTPMDFKLALFLGLFVTREYGMLLTMVFFFLSDIVPALLGGESVNGPDLFFFGWYFIVNILVLFFPNIPLVTLGPFLVIVHDLGAIYINSKVGGIPGYLSFIVSFMTSLVRIIYFLTLGRLVEILFALV